ncbi:hypothetical protein QBC46DRAFT_295147 [Diplogelasinospora grovesii]|uniref:Carrier domain-containing protein n=1 Tax=Diplogelasinospora grovesii TaxID=303347 RepID=A0AAN6N413_9PEZI|nr:hypothetical protein QBC46DRAFT_295147 [Diplogelasinospora grovesii]
MAGPDLCYFTCTLGQAERWNQDNPNPCRTVQSLLDHQARSIPNLPAVAFADRARQGISSGKIASPFSSVTAAANNLAEALSCHGIFPGSCGKRPVIGLLGRSSVEFLLSWLALMELGCSVLLLAPQLEVAAIEHICETCAVCVIVSDTENRDKTNQVRQVSAGVNGIALDEMVGGKPAFNKPTPSCRKQGRHTCQPSEVAYVFHTSGTSSGRPKPIPETHHAAVALLPQLPQNKNFPTFSTTPLYHGGVADCLRAWASGAMIWLFPERRLPITAANVRSCLEFADQQGPAPVFFTSVPYVLQIMAEDADCLQRLRNMRLVGVGGAALAPAVGNALVTHGVNLVSRYGSVECGFLLTSHRDYAVDREWQYLRADDAEHISFEAREDGLSELVVAHNWPHLAKRNREDGSYATSDLFIPHPKMPNAWKYHSRADAQLTLSNGKKFDPAPMEAAILSSSPHLLRDVFIFGSGREYPGMLLFPAAAAQTDPEALMEAVWPSIDRMNQESQNHARMSRLMISVVNVPENQTPLDKSSKGTILRSRAEARYSREIHATYNPCQSRSLPEQDVADGDISGHICRIFEQFLGRRIDPDHDVYQQGVDSMACLQLRTLIKSTLLKRHEDLPANIIYDMSTVRALAQYVSEMRQGRGHLEILEEHDELGAMRGLVGEFTRFPSARYEPRGRAVVLTGATGALGAHILNLLRNDPHVQKVYCLVRAQTFVSAHKRVSDGLKARGMPGLEPFQEGLPRAGRIECLPSQLHERSPHFNLAEPDWMRVRDSVTLVVHAAWAVNFTLRLNSFRDNIASTHHLLNLAIASGARLLFISSLSAVASFHDSDGKIPETLSHNPGHASAVGYSRSKWVAEQICAAAYNQLTAGVRDKSMVNQSPVTIIRVGQLCGDQSRGVWNASEAYPLMLSTAKMAKCLPNLGGVSMDWLPVDLAAKAVLEIAGCRAQRAVCHQIPVYHVLNWHLQPTWSQGLKWITADAKSETGGRIDIEIVHPQVWLSRLEAAFGDGMNPHSTARSLLPFWRRVYAPDKNGDGGEIGDTASNGGGGHSSFPPCAGSVSNTMQTLRPLNRVDVIKMWHWIRNNVGVARAYDTTVENDVKNKCTAEVRPDYKEGVTIELKAKL